MNTVRSLQDSQQAKQKNSNKVTQQLQMARRKNSEYRSMLRSMTDLMPGPTNGSVTLVKVGGRREKEGGRRGREEGEKRERRGREEGEQWQRRGRRGRDVGGKRERRGERTGRENIGLPGLAVPCGVLRSNVTATNMLFLTSCTWFTRPHNCPPSLHVTLLSLSLLLHPLPPYLPFPLPLPSLR